MFYHVFLRTNLSDMFRRTITSMWCVLRSCFVWLICLYAILCCFMFCHIVHCCAVFWVMCYDVSVCIIVQCCAVFCVMCYDVSVCIIVQCCAVFCVMCCDASVCIIVQCCAVFCVMCYDASVCILCLVLWCCHCYLCLDTSVYDMLCGFMLCSFVFRYFSVWHVVWVYVVQFCV